MKAQLADGRDYTLDLDLSHAVVPSACAYSVLRSKVELKMAKCEGIRWNSLEGTSGQDKVKHIPSAPIATAIEVADLLLFSSKINCIDKRKIF